MKITIWSYTYQLKKLTTGERYITRQLSKKGFKKWQAGQLSVRAGIL